MLLKSVIPGDSEIGVTELEPRLFSINNPSGACPGCDGLGVKQFFDPDRVVMNSDLSLAGGAVRGWDSEAPMRFARAFDAYVAHSRASS